MSRFPNRTLVLMLLALLAFAWMYVQLHRAQKQAAPVRPDDVQWIDLRDGGLP